MDASAHTGRRPAIAFAELVAVIAAVMALNALAIDIMLPALGQIGDTLGAAHDNDRQLIVIVYLIANGVSQLFAGPLVDRFGRKTVLLWTLGGYTAGSIFCVFAPTFEALIAARAFQGITTGGARVGVMAVVRDLHKGRRMAEVMSLAMMIFMAVPILAPAFGQAILFTAPWRGIFVVLLVYGAVVGVWIALRIPETMTPEQQKPLKLRSVMQSYGEFAANRISMGYTLVMAFATAALFGFISASEQIFLETFKTGAVFVVAFAAISLAFGAASVTNARLVMRYGTRRLSHSALVLFLAANVIHLLTISMFGDHFFVFMAFMALTFFSVGLIAPNATAMAMQPMGHMAGAGAAANGFASTAIGAFLGGAIARTYNGSTQPIIAGFAVLAVVALALTLWIERGRLFHPEEQDPAP